MILKNIKKITVVLISCMLMACSLVSCKGVEITGKTEDVAGYTEAECRIVIGSERNRYQNALGAEIWNLPVENQFETTYGPYFVARIKEFLQDIKTLNLLAERTGIIATSTEMDTIRTIAGQFYDSLTPEDKEFMGDCSLDDVIHIYTEYFVACKTANYLISDADLEVSDAEVKVIKIQLIEKSDLAEAQKLLELVNVEGANFAYYARQNSEDTDIEKTLSKSDSTDELYTAAFSLEEGQISDIISKDGKYYIIKCINAYDEEATHDKKKKLESALKSKAFFDDFGEYKEQHIVRFREPFWNEIDLSQNSESKADNFFELFDENVNLK
ncbi:peptidylprolyl isomerase [Oribacterium sp. WCC10]|uniref:peptidylprolyl isomerase n=1 Tax=Oribacterium sp. WCC10 TaxID=1855343 RepID=UPI0008E8BB36|nr:peptidylprolyl isomerase [Oribacterium sp. WCC10]SFG20975.1 foldase protein PrsA [Oribacterium sp. WCC10]